MVIAALTVFGWLRQHIIWTSFLVTMDINNGLDHRSINTNSSKSCFAHVCGGLSSACCYDDNISIASPSSNQEDVGLNEMKL